MHVDGGSGDRTGRMPHTTMRVNGRSQVILTPARAFAFSTLMS